MSQKIDSLLQQAAAMRAAGSSWKQVAAALQRDEDNIKHWPSRYPEEWSRYTSAALDHLVTQAYGEAVQTLRDEMRSEVEKYRVAASVVVAKMRNEQRRLEIMAQRPGPAPQRASRPDDDVDDEISDEDLPAEIERLIALYRAVQRADEQDLENKTPPDGEKPAEGGNTAA
jgi:vacuolar-type H+-ATPase catalytic subunit A/Vma1